MSLAGVHRLEMGAGNAKFLYMDFEIVFLSHADRRQPHAEKLGHFSGTPTNAGLARNLKSLVV